MCSRSTMFLAVPLRCGCSRRLPMRSAAPRSWRPRRKPVRTRKAVVTDAREVHDLIAQYSGDGTLLPRRYGEICENIRDFVVVEHRGRIVACGALHIYGPHLGEVRSIAVAPEAQGRGAGRRLVRVLVAEAERHQITRVCLFTRIPE